MHIRKCYIAFALFFAGYQPTLAAEGEEPHQLELVARNLYWNHHKQGGLDQREWGQGLRLDFRSRYTPGTIGIGVELGAYSLLKLQGNATHSGQAGVLVPTGTGGTKDAAFTGGGAIKLRIANTELRYGNNLRPYNPVFAVADTRILPATVQGWWLQSQDIPNTTLEAGNFIASRDFNSTHFHRQFYASYAGVSTDMAGFIGGRHTINDALSVSAYASKFRDIWRQYYGNVNYTIPLPSAQNLNMDFNIYRSDSTGKKLAGAIGVTAWSFLTAYNVGAHTFKVSFQKINGAQPFDYLGLGPGTFHDSIYLANSSQLSDFNGPGEQSWGVFYSVDMTTYNLPGLSFHARYIRGSKANGDRLPAHSPYSYYAHGEKHWERDLELRYVVPSGRAKNLLLRVRYATHRINGSSDTSSDQLRLIVEYPYNFL
ncbi:OprD family outer membrane porin [Paenalcaligenes sp. Me131]|uniref:OprD family outer membrane porin n=1 Tax=Paenalcaligenes sp. Me131 TaxID=3392636 RepID=UPI003D291F4E